MALILVVDDEVGIRELLSEILSDEGYSVEQAENASAARAAMNNNPDLVLLDIWMPDIDGISLLKEWSSTGRLTMPVIMMSGHATLDTAIEATKFGAVDFLEKPIALRRLISSVRSALEKNSPELKIGERKQASGATITRLVTQQTSGGVQPTAAIRPPSQREPDPREELLAQLAAIDFSAPLRDARDHFERIYFTHLLKRERNSVTKVASCAGLERTHLYRKLKQLGLEVGRAGKSKEKEKTEKPFEE